MEHLHESVVSREQGGSMPARYNRCSAWAYSSVSTNKQINFLLSTDKPHQTIFPWLLPPNPMPPCSLLPNRYIQWMFTTPTILFVLSKISALTPTQVFLTIVADVTMVITGLLAGLLPHPFQCGSASCMLRSGRGKSQQCASRDPLRLVCDLHHSWPHHHLTDTWPLS